MQKFKVPMSTQSISAKSRDTVNPLAVLKRPHLRDFLRYLYLFYWEKAGLPTDLLEVMWDVFDEHIDDPTEARREIHRRVPDFVNLNSVFHQRTKVLTAGTFNQFANKISPFVVGTVLMDLGAGGAQLIDLIVDEVDSVKRGFFTDVNQPYQPSTKRNVQFVQQPSPDTTGFPQQSVDTIIMSRMLHHVSAEQRSKLIDHARQILRRDGRILVIEDSFPDTIEGISNPDEPTRRLYQLTPPERLETLQIRDFTGTHVFRNLTEIPLKYTHLTIGQWIALFSTHGLRLISQEFTTDMFPPRAIMVFEVASKRAHL